jgi:hypothetical protein
MKRRKFITSTLLVAVGAGCSSNSQSGQRATSSEGSGESTTETQTSTATPNPANRHLDAFERDLSRAEIEIQALELQLPVTSLQYRTTKRDREAVSRQIGRVSGFFFKQIEAGWSVDRLDAEAHVDEGPTFTWRAKAEWYESYAADELTSEELSFKVLDTATRKE